MMRNSCNDAKYQRPDPIAGQNDRTGKDAVTIYDNAVGIAKFLATNYPAASLEQKRFIAEMACEVAQRFSEDFPG
jgi:hypothetical protein